VKILVGLSDQPEQQENPSEKPPETSAKPVETLGNHQQDSLNQF